MQHHIDKRPGAGCKETEKHTLSANHLIGYLEVAEHVDISIGAESIVGGLACNIEGVTYGTGSVVGPVCRELKASLKFNF